MEMYRTASLEHSPNTMILTGLIRRTNALYN